ncbi:hypothetical protein ACQPVP_12970 [Clostridium nigeriense]
MKIKKLGKLAIVAAAGAALIATLINDNKANSKKKVKLEDEK